MENLLTADAGNTGWQNDRALTDITIGDVLVVQGKLDEGLKFFRDSFAVRERLTKAAPDLARGVTCENIPRGWKQSKPRGRSG